MRDILLVLLGVGMASLLGCTRPVLLPDVEVEEQIYTYEPAGNGSGPLWCYGSTCIVRLDDDVFASGIETLKGVEPLCNVRWQLFKRGEKGWALQQVDEKDRQREPCPLACFRDGRLLLSVNPNRAEPGERGGPAEPQVLEFSAADPAGPYKTLLPAWDGSPEFREHSYRAFCADGRNGEALLLNILGHEAQHWSFLDRNGKWSRHGKLVFPMGKDYEEPERIRLCYPVVALRNRAAHVLAVSDIIEPVKAWREYKLVLHHGKKWDYDFRRLFYTWTPDITKVPFSPWIEIASREKTAGHITNLDMWLDKKGRAHLLWKERSVWDLRMRAKFFPDVPVTTSLMYCVIDKGNVIQRTKLAEGGEGLSSEVPGYARLHATPDDRLFVFYYCGGKDAEGKVIAENRLMEIFPDGSHGKPMRVPLEHPFTAFMTATERGGSPPSNMLDVLGIAAGRPGISYARIALFSRIRADFAFTLRRNSTGWIVELDGTRSFSVAGKMVSWQWNIGGAKATGGKTAHTFNRSGPIAVVLTVTDEKGNKRSVTRTIHLPIASADLGLKTWGLPLRTEAETYAKEGGGKMHLRTEKLGASALSLSHWNTKGHWLEWDVDIPKAGDYFLLVRYACPKDAVRALTIDGKSHGAFHFSASGGYGSAYVDNWSLDVLRSENGKPKPLRLSQGPHRVRFENTDGEGLNLDYLEWVAKDAGAAPPLSGRVIDEADYRYAIPLRGTVCPTQVSPEQGHCYMVPLGAHYPGDGTEAAPSKLHLFEDGKELGPAHVSHAEIRSKGQGRFSHYGDTLRFSASDNSDPRTNGRIYTWRISP
ncbi:MAG: hypothetical protein GXP25_01035 [Planctomycetes bacterium]|nr:hypothetical protein [Planctomycetota bacterium]